MSQDLEAGTRIGSYSIESVVGRGGMGVVYLARHEALGRQVALKVLPQQLAEDQAFRERFLREAKLAASLDHPNIIPVYDAGEVERRLFIAMRFVRGTDLHRVLQEQGTIPASTALAVLSKVAGALDAAHARGLVHRDVKPANILIEPASGQEAERVFLSDFGLTKSVTSESALTKSGFFVGTLDYAAPEQFKGGTLDGRTDVYALGCVLYQCLAGTAPFVRESDQAIIAGHLFDPPPLLSERRIDMPSEVDAVITRAMAKEREERYPSCTSLMTAAQSALGSAAERSGLSPAGIIVATQPLPPVAMASDVAQPTQAVERAPSTVPGLRASGPGPPRRRRLGLVLGIIAAFTVIAGVVAVLALNGDGRSGAAGGGSSTSTSPSSSASQPAAVVVTVDSYVKQTLNLLDESSRSRGDLVRAVQAAGQGPAQAQAQIPAVRKVLESRRTLLQTVSSWDVPPEAASANSQLAQSFQDSLSDDVIYLEFVKDLAAGDQSRANADLDTLDAQRQATHAHKAEFLREFNQLLQRSGRPPLPADFAY